LIIPHHCLSEHILSTDRLGDTWGTENQQPRTFSPFNGPIREAIDPHPPRPLGRRGGTPPARPAISYPSRNAAIVGLIAYAVAFPRPHQLTAALAKMSPEDQDIVHDFLLKAAREGINLRDVLPKPATAEALLRLAKSK